MFLFSHCYDFFNIFNITDIAWIDSNLINSRFHSEQGYTVIEMNIRNHGQGRLGTDRLECIKTIAPWNRHANNFASSLGERLNLRKIRVSAVSLGVEHRLHRDWRSSANWHVANHDLMCALVRFHNSPVLDGSIVRQTEDTKRVSLF